MSEDLKRNEEVAKMPHSASASGAPTSEAINQSRRRFTQAGFAASGVILSLNSPSVLATTKTSMSPSGFVSGNRSRGPDHKPNGRSPGYWKNHLYAWPCSTNIKFNSVFKCYRNSVYSKYTFVDLLEKKKDDRHNFGMHLVAAWLNAKSGLTPFLREDVILSMYSQWQEKGYFSPIPNGSVQWGAEDIVQYLKATQV